MGGFLGQDVAAFVSAVISGAAGMYMLTLVGDANVETDLMVQPGQHVIITGSPDSAALPSWGSGGFAVRQDGLLSITSVALQGPIVLAQGALSVTLSSCSIGGRVFGSSSSYTVPSATMITIVDPASHLDFDSVTLGATASLTVSQAHSVAFSVLEIGHNATGRISGVDGSDLRIASVRTRAGGTLSVQGPITLANQGLILGALSPGNQGSISFQDVMVSWTGYDAAVRISGALPGSLQAMKGADEGSLTWSHGDDVVATGFLDNINSETFWDSGLTTNALGRTFSLFLMPTQAPNVFTNDPTGAQRYADVCTMAGLQTVGTGTDDYVAAGFTLGS